MPRPVPLLSQAAEYAMLIYTITQSSSSSGFWCHEDAPIIHPVGWSREVGHEIVASQSYHEKCIRGTYDPNDAPPELFATTPLPAYLRNAKTTFTEGMKLEAIDPLNLSAICVATIMKVSVLMI